LNVYRRGTTTPPTIYTDVETGTSTHVLQSADRRDANGNLDRLGRGRVATTLAVSIGGVLVNTTPWEAVSSSRMRIVPTATGVAATDTANVNAVIAAASAGDEVWFQDGTYVLDGVTVNKKLSLRMYGAAVQTPASNNNTTLTFSGNDIRVYGFEMDGNRTNQSGRTHADVLVTGSNVHFLGKTYLHHNYSTGFYVFDADEVQVDAFKSDNSRSTPFYAETSTANRSGLRANVVIDRTSEAAGSIIGYGVQVHRNTGSYTGIEIRGRVVLPSSPTSTCLDVEVWGGCADVTIDLQTQGGSMGASMDRVDRLQGQLDASGSLNIGLELVGITGVGSRHNFRAVIECATGAGVSISNTLPKDFVLDLNVVHTGTGSSVYRCIKAQNLDGYLIRGRLKMGSAGAYVAEFIKCTNGTTIFDIDGRSSGGTAATQDGLTFDQCSNVVDQSTIRHTTRNSIVLSGSSGSPVHDVALRGHYEDWGAASPAVGVYGSFVTNCTPRFTHDRSPVRSAAGSIGPGEEYIIGDTSGGTLAQTLPPASASRGVRLDVRRKGANTLTLNRAGTDTINGATSYALTADKQVVTLRPDDTTSDWGIV
jgi:hypothetical protein